MRLTPLDVRQKQHELVVT